MDAALADRPFKRQNVLSFGVSVGKSACKRERFGSKHVQWNGEVRDPSSSIGDPEDRAMTRSTWQETSR